MTLRSDIVRIREKAGWHPSLERSDVQSEPLGSFLPCILKAPPSLLQRGFLPSSTAPSRLACSCSNNTHNTSLLVYYHLLPILSYYIFHDHCSESLGLRSPSISLSTKTSSCKGSQRLLSSRCEWTEFVISCIASTSVVQVEEGQISLSSKRPRLRNTSLGKSVMDTYEQRFSLALNAIPELVR